MQIFFFVDWVRHLLNDPKLFRAFLRATVFTAITVGGLALTIGTATGAPGCFLLRPLDQLLGDPTP